MNFRFGRCVVVAGILLVGCSPAKKEADWIDLFDGVSLDGWVATSEANWSVEEGVITVSERPAGFLTCETGLEDFELTVDFRAEAKTNSGVFVSFDKEPTDPSVDCYEINIAPPDNPFPTGSIVARERVSPEVAADQWHTFKIEVISGVVRIALDGDDIVEHEADPVSAGGWIGLQMREGPVSFREIRVRER